MHTSAVKQVVPGVNVLERVTTGGWCWNVVTVALPGGGTLVYSASWLDDETFARVEALGTPKILCAPNHEHHVALERYRQRWPEAIAVASAEALPRLQKKGHGGLRSVDEVTALLPPGSAWHPCEGTKTGETWLSVPHAGGKTLLLCDAFFNLTEPTTGVLGFALRSLGVAPGLRVSGAYKLLAVRDLAAYRAWTLKAVQTIAPTEVVVGHGAPVTGPDCAARLVLAVEARWPMSKSP